MCVCMHDIVHVVNRKPTGHRGIVIFPVTQLKPDIIETTNKRKIDYSVTNNQ